MSASGRAKAKRVLFVNSSSRLYGADRSLLEIVARLDKTAFDPVVLVPETGPLVAEMQRLGASAIVSPFVHAERRDFRLVRLIRFAAALLLSIGKIKSIIEKEKIDLVHSNTSACIAGAVASRLARKPHIWHIRELCTNPKIVRLFYRVAIPMLADRAIAASTAVMSNYSAGRNKLAQKFVLLSHGVDQERFENGNDVIREEFSLPPGTKIVGSVGMLRAQKGQHLFLQAAKMVKEKHPGARFVISGDMYYKDGAIDPGLKNLCRRLGLENDVIFTGFRSDIENVFASFDVFAHTSAYRESYGRTILESMSAGKPVIAFDHGGPRELVRDGRTGFLVPPGDVGLMAEKISALLSDGALRVQMGDEGRKTVRERYSNEKYMKSLQEIYSQCLRMTPQK